MDVSMDVVGDQVTVWVLAMPVPDSATFWLPASVATVSVALFAPALLGSNVIAMVHVAPIARLAPSAQVLVPSTAKSAAFVPEMVMPDELIASGPVPLLVNVVVDAAVAPSRTPCEPRSKLAGEMLAPGAANEGYEPSLIDQMDELQPRDVYVIADFISEVVLPVPTAEVDCPEVSVSHTESV